MKIFGVVILILALVAGGYFGYQYYQGWKNKEIERSKELQIIELLQKQQGTILTLRTEIAEIEKRIVTDTLKEKTVIKEEAPTYESKKEELIELRKDPEVNEEKIKVARIEFEERINEFQESPDKILINTGEEKIVIYEDDQGNLVSLESGITITRHRDVKEVIGDLQAGKEVEVTKKTGLELKAGGYYSFDSTYGVIISKGILGIKDYSLNVSLLINDFEDFKLKLGADVGYEIRDNIELAVGYNTEKEFYGALRWSF